MRKFLTILGWIFLAILLSPLIAIALYLIVGGSLFFILYLICRIKYGPIDRKEHKLYSTISTILILLELLFAYILISRIENYTFVFWSWQTYLGLQAITFIGLIPIDIFYIKKLKHHNIY